MSKSLQAVLSMEKMPYDSTNYSKGSTVDNNFDIYITLLGAAYKSHAR